jgi:ATP-dependent DNA helicase RecQ
VRDIHEILKTYWGYDEFRSLQENIIRSVLDGNDTLALMPTGGGKSLCFQVPALARDGVCIVVSPLIALMNDQVINLKKIGIKALALHSGMSYKEIDYSLDRCVHGDIKMLYVSPERLQTDLFRGRFQRMKVNLIAVDEAHCISQWGYDFRPPYLKIAELREIQPKVPILALTATATEKVVDDIQEKLEFKKANVLRKSFARDNLAYVVVHEENKRDRLLNICKKVNGTGVVYVRNRKKTEEIAAFLQRNGVSANAYHAGLNAEIRSERQADWTHDKVRIVVATNAFGMGIDKPDVRFVVHLDLPEDIESYFQEAGRGGRDGKKAWAIVLKEKSDILDLEQKVQRKFPEKETIRKAYRALLNHLQLAAGSGQDSSFPVDIGAVSRSFNISTIDLYNSFKLLENEGYFTFSESFYSPSRLRFIVQNNTLYDFQLRQTALSDFIQLLLRSYSGLFDAFVKIDERELARRLDEPVKNVIKKLQMLQNQQIIEYTPACDTAMVTFTQPAQYDRDLSLSKAIYDQRKQLAFEKMKAMVGYLEPGVCRQRRLLNYFGELTSKDCGHCDICLENRKNEKGDQSEEIEQRIINTLREQPRRPDEIVNELTDYNREMVIKKVIWLVDEHVLYYQPDKRLAVDSKADKSAKGEDPKPNATEHKP